MKGKRRKRGDDRCGRWTCGYRESLGARARASRLFLTETVWEFPKMVTFLSYIARRSWSRDKRRFAGSFSLFRRIFLLASGRMVFPPFYGEKIFSLKKKKENLSVGMKIHRKYDGSNTPYTIHRERISLANAGAQRRQRRHQKIILSHMTIALISAETFALWSSQENSRNCWCTPSLQLRHA